MRSLDLKSILRAEIRMQSGFEVASHPSIEHLREGFFCKLDISVSGEAPKDFIAVYVHGRGRKAQIDDALETTVRTYRRNLWSTQSCYIEVWVEKDAIAGVVAKTANSFGVPVFVARGFASLSSLYDAANTFREATDAGKTAIIYHLGDYDPSGVAAGESVLRAFRDDFKVELQFTRIAVTQEQIRRLNLLTRPTKSTDTRAKKWTGGECVELDSIPPAEIRSLVESCITRHIDQHEWDTLKQTELMEKETLRSIRSDAA